MNQKNNTTSNVAVSAARENQSATAEHMYKDLSPTIQTVFKKLGFLKIEGRGKPYYKGLKQGKIFRVATTNKLRELKDGATETEYGYVKLKQLDGTFKDEAVHRLIAESIPNEENKPVVHHKKGLRNRNGIDELQWATYKENRGFQIEETKRKGM